MYIKPSNPVPTADRTGNSLRAGRKTGSGAESFKDLLEEIDVVELSAELDPDEKRKKDLQKQREEGQAKETPEAAEIKQENSLRGINRFV